MTARQAPKFHRQRFLLFLLEQAGGVSISDFQRLLFLSHQETLLRYYDSVRYGDNFHSFQAISDLEVLEQKDWLGFSEDTVFLKDKPYLGSEARKEERWLLSKWISKYKEMIGGGLVQLIDERYPNKIQQDDSQNNTELFTIGYEGFSIELYLTKLIENKVQVLYDVRRNPFSHKFGFSKGVLSRILSDFDIEYRHIPELGIASQKRKDLNNELDYVALFDEYREHLPEKRLYLQELASTLQQGKRVALTCFEGKPKSCHRHCVSDYLTSHWDVGVVHL